MIKYEIEMLKRMYQEEMIHQNGLSSSIRSYHKADLIQIEINKLRKKL